MRNYLNRVVANKKVGKVICLQGGIIHNEELSPRFMRCSVPGSGITPYYDVTGAYGAATGSEGGCIKTQC